MEKDGVMLKRGDGERWSDVEERGWEKDEVMDEERGWEKDGVMDEERGWESDG